MATSKKINLKNSSIKFSRKLNWLLIFLPILIAVAWSIWPSAKVFLAVRSFDASDVRNLSENAEKSADLKRNIQRYLLSWDIYVATDDMASSTELRTNQAVSWEDVKKLCGDGDFFVWLPLKIRVPIAGALEREWCWTLRS